MTEEQKDDDVVDAEIVGETPSTDLAVTGNFTPAKIEGGLAYFDQYLELANKIAKTAMVPADLRGNGDQVLAVFMYGAELGMGPMQSLSQINFIEGRPSLKPEAMRALIRKAGHKLDISQSSVECVITGTRGDTGEVGEASFTVEDAESANLLMINKDTGEIRARSSGGKVLPWEAYTKDMLLARATSRIARMMFSDVIAGLSYTPEEIHSFADDEEAKPARKARKATKKQTTTTRQAPQSDDGPDLGTDEQKVEFATNMALIAHPDDVAKLADRWKHLKPGLPPARLLVTKRDYERAITLVKGVLNDVEGFDESDEGEGEPEGTGASQVDAGDLPAMATAAQVKSVAIKATRLGLSDRKDRLARISAIVGVRIYSMKNLTQAQAHKVIDTFNAELD
jgi:hypothetical protein